MATITATVTWQGTKHDVTVRPVDQLAYERVARQLKWPMPGNDALGPITYLAGSAGTPSSAPASSPTT